MVALDPVTRMIQNLAGRITGPLAFRLIIQPSVALFFGLRDGARDGCEGRPAYLWHLLSKPHNRRTLVRSGWKSIGTVFMVAVIIDAIYQFIELHWFYPGEALVLAFILACVPYLLIRGPVSRIVRTRVRKGDDLERVA